MQLYNHQLKIIDEDPKKVGLFLGTGSGKTRTALMLAKGSTLVVCPKTQFEDGNWTREFGLLHGIQVGSRYIAGTNKHTIMGKDVLLTVMSKETFKRFVQNGEIYKSSPYNTFIVDESHTALGVMPSTVQRKKVTYPKASQLYEALDEYVKRTKPERIYLCTATIMKSPFTVWAAMQILGKQVQIMRQQGAQGEDVDLNTFYGFRHFFYTRLPMPGREVWAPKKTLEAKTSLAALVRNLGYTGRLEDFFDVPDQTFKTEYIELTQKQKDRIKTLRMDYPEPLVRVGKRHQIENGCLSGDQFNAPESFANAKVDKILDYALEFPRMVIFARYRAQIDMLDKELTKAGYKVWTLTGDTKDRGSVIAEANASAEGIFIAQCQVSAGWELPEYPVMIFASKDYSFVNYDQALGRIQRANNIKKNLYITLVVRGGVDEAVDRAVADKVDFNEKIYEESTGNEA